MAHNILNIIINTISQKKKKNIGTQPDKKKHWQTTFNFCGDDIIPKGYFLKKKKQF